MTAPPDKPYVTVTDKPRGDYRIAVSFGARNCIHGRPLKPIITKGTALTGPVCHTCEWEIEQLARKPSERT